ncbi:TPA: plasmid mobilization protein MobA [Serratia liquefaciens]
MSKPKSEKRQRTELFLGIRWLPEEKEQVAASAKAAGMSAGEFLRCCALGRQIVPRGDVDQMKALLKLGGLQKHLYSEMQRSGMMTPEMSKQYADVLTQIKIAIIQFGKMFS